MLPAPPLTNAIQAPFPSGNGRPAPVSLHVSRWQQHFSGLLYCYTRFLPRTGPGPRRAGRFPTAAIAFLRALFGRAGAWCAPPSLL